MLSYLGYLGTKEELPTTANNLSFFSAKCVPTGACLPGVELLCQHYIGEGGVEHGPKWVRLTPNGTNPRLYKIRFQYILAR